MKLVRHKVTGEHLALKMLVKSDLLQMSQAVHVRAERSILSELDHPYIIRMCALPRPRASTPGKKYEGEMRRTRIGEHRLLVLHLRDTGRWRK